MRAQAATVRQAGGVDRLDRRTEQLDVVAARSVDRPAQWHAVTLDADRPLPSEFGPVRRVLPGALTAVGGLVEAAVDGHFGEVEFDDPIERCPQKLQPVVGRVVGSRPCWCW